MIDRVKDDVRFDIAFAKTKHAGALASQAWLAARGLQVPASAPWDVGIAFEDEDSRLHIAIGFNEWGFFFGHKAQMSWIRVMDVPFVHERDDFGLIGKVPPLRDLGVLVQALEERTHVRFDRSHATIRTTIPDSEALIRIWVAASI